MPLKTLNELPRDLRMVYNKGFEAYQRENYDYAIEMFNQILIKEPYVFEIRKTLRDAQVARSGKAGGFFKRALSSASSSPLVAKGQLALRKNPLEAIQIAEQILSSDANSSGGHKLLAEAALAAEMPREAVMSLEILVKASPKDKDLSYQLAEALAGSGEKTKGEHVLVQLQREYPGDAEISNKLKDLSARKTLDEGGYAALEGGKGSYRDVLKDKAESVALEQANRQVKTDDVAAGLIKDWEDRLKTEPNNLKMLRNLAETYRERQDYDKSLSYYERMMAVDGGTDSSLLKQIADVKLRRIDQSLAKLDTTAVDYAERVAQVKAERQTFQLDECKSRAERYPTDLQIRFELGQLYFDAGKITEAMQEFQKAQTNPNRRVQSITYLAKCFEKKNMFDLAARRLLEVLKDKISFDDEKKDLLYTLGCVYEKMNKKGESIEQFKLIYEVDSGYKDVAKRVEDYYASGGT
jgi:tetratricopeptide (TPR) repeat protein